MPVLLQLHRESLNDSRTCSVSNRSSSLRPQWSTIPQGEFRRKYQELSSLHNLATFWGVRPWQLSYYAFRVDKRTVYRTFHIPRRNGRERQIDAPTPTLKYIQRLIHESLVPIYGPHPGAHGFVIQRSILTNARNHTGRRYILNVDLADFFPSITRKRIYGRLVAAPYSLDQKVANLIAALSTDVYSRLPQGSPSSPVLANIVASELDSDLAKLCGSLGCWYTRYADDITISTRGEMPPQLARYPNALGTGQVVIGDRLLDVIQRHGFRINDRKSRLQSYWTRQLCTGLVVNSDRISPPRSYIRRLRSLIDHWQKNGWQDAAQVLHSRENRPLFADRQALMNHVTGRIGYLKMVRGQNDPVSQRLDRIVACLP